MCYFGRENGALLHEQFVVFADMDDLHVLVRAFCALSCKSTYFHARTHMCTYGAHIHARAHAHADTSVHAVTPLTMCRTQARIQTRTHAHAHASGRVHAQAHADIHACTHA